MHPTGCQDMAFVNDTGKECLLSLDAVTLPKQINTVYVSDWVCKINHVGTETVFYFIA